MRLFYRSAAAVLAFFGFAVLSAQAELTERGAVASDSATLLVIGTSSDDRLSQLRAGGAAWQAPGRPAPGRGRVADGPRSPRTRRPGCSCPACRRR